MHSHLRHANRFTLSTNARDTFTRRQRVRTEALSTDQAGPGDLSLASALGIREIAPPVAFASQGRSTAPFSVLKRANKVIHLSGLIYTIPPLSSILPVDWLSTRCYSGKQYQSTEQRTPGFNQLHRQPNLPASHPNPHKHKPPHPTP